MSLAAIIQLTTTADPEPSLQHAEVLIDEAVARGAALVALPENLNFMGPESEKLDHAENDGGPTWARMANKARQHSIHLLAGTIPELAPTVDRVFNTSVLFGPDGNALARYRKIHLFDVALGPDATHRESDHVLAGDAIIVAATPLGGIGMSVCYDLRFPEQYRAMAAAGAEILCVPSAFTVPTGRDHWEVLLRARAIENQCYVLAPAQVGQNTPGRATYGRSMIIDPWGTVLATCPDEPSFAIAEIDLERLRSLRARMPALAHRRPFRGGT